MKLFILFSLFLTSIITDAQTNLIKNGGFEYDLTNWNGQENGALSPYDKKSGKNSALINQYTGAEWRAFDQTVSLAKNTYAVECSAWMKAEGIENQKEEYKAAAVIIEFTNSADKQVGTETIARAKGTTDWVNYKKAVKVPDDAKKIRVMLALAQTNGTVFFDDIKMTTLSEEEFSKLNSETK
ncbi:MULTISPECIES: carbohydrate binding domain-containing protein [Flavobacterium]|uniref:carbohydrate binding domain-containing protein n=1 Tax=Flavobacterium TaxID=237 RepID=UPI00118319F5|nr:MULTISPECIES: carbohydrate binding domain-containing protein [Flavobacterium]MCR4032287.1 hypothetical protein [Flavobacterium panacis]